jgi:predicted HAD superfamily Cof-like phosphohydrolase
MTNTEIQYYISNVKQFIERGLIPTRKHKIEDLVFTYEQILSEFQELQEAKEAKDKIEILDAYLDVMYFSFSCSLIFNLDIESRLPKVRTKAKSIDKHIDLLESNFSNVDKFTDTLAELIVICHNLIKALKFNPLDTFKEVHDANMRKYTKIASQAIIGAGLNQKKYKTPCKWEQNEEYYIVYTMQHNGKRILKPYGWIEPDLERFLK